MPPVNRTNFLQKPFCFAILLSQICLRFADALACIRISDISSVAIHTVLIIA